MTPVTPTDRLKLSRLVIRRLARLLFPYIGEKVGKGTRDAMALATFSQVTQLREDYRTFAARNMAHQLQLPQIPRVEDLPPIQAFELDAWKQSVGKAINDDQVVEDEEAETPVDRVIRARDVERVLIKADLHGRNAERNQMVAIAVNDDRVKGWARVDYVLPTCPLCRLTISRGPVYRSAKSAGGENNQYHGGCTCEVVLVLEGQENYFPGHEIFLRERAFYKANAKGRNAIRAYRKAVKAQNDEAVGKTKQTVDKAVDDQTGGT